MHTEETEQLSFPFATPCVAHCGVFCSRELKKYFIDQEGVRMAVSSMLRSPVLFVFFDIDERVDFQMFYGPVQFLWPVIFFFSLSPHISFSPAYSMLLLFLHHSALNVSPLKCLIVPLPHSG